MGRETGDTNLGGIAPGHLPDDLFAEALTGNRAATIQGPNT